MRKIFEQVNRSVISYLILLLSLHAPISIAETYLAQGNERLQVKISKSGLNRICNPPYKITQVTGDNSKFSFKFDEDGSNIYFMPLAAIGEKIEISIKNNAGFVQDLELEVRGIKGKVVTIDGRSSMQTESTHQSDIAGMLRAMKDNKAGKFYVQHTKQKLANIGDLLVEQLKVYKYKDLVGGVFEITNPTRERIDLDVSLFAKRFENLKTSYPNSLVIEPRQKVKILIVQGAPKE